MRCHFLFAAFLVDAFMVTTAVAQTRTADDTTSSRQPDRARTSAPSDMTAEAALRAARELVDRLDTSGRALTEPDANRLKEYVDIIRTEAPDNPWPGYLQGRMLAMTGRHFDAISLLRKFLETREGRNDWQAYRVLGDLFVQEYPQLARSQYQTAQRLKPDEPTVLYGLSLCAYFLGNVGEATDLARRAVDADRRQSLRLLRHLVRVLSANEDWAEAARTAVEALHLAQAEARAEPELQESWQAVDAQYQLVIETFQKRLTGAPGTDEEYFELVEYIRLRADNVKRLAVYDVLAVLEQGVEDTAPDTSPALREKYAVALAEAGRREQALEEFAKVLVDNPASVTATDWLSRLRAAEDEAATGETP